MDNWRIARLPPYSKSGYSTLGSWTQLDLPFEQYEAPTHLAEQVFYINTDEHKKRNAHAKALLQSIGFKNITRVKPIYDPVMYTSLTKTHKYIVEQIAAKPDSDKYYCIFEDDIELADEFVNRPQEVKNYIERSLDLGLIDPIGFIYLGVCLDANQVQSCTRNRCNAWCAHAYMVSPKGARWLLDNIKDWEKYHADYAYLKTLSAPVVGHEFNHDHTFPRWKGLFYQARNAEWYESGQTESLLGNTN
jgi:hypothetical protein